MNQFLWTGRDNDVIREKKVVGGGSRRTQCPVCFSSDRDRLVWLFLRLRLGVHGLRNAMLLHIAPERQLQRRLRSLRLRYVAGDRLEGDYTYPRDTLPLDVTRLPFRAATFDIVICNHVLEHVPRDDEAMRELHRVMKPGATAILQVPIALELAVTYEDEKIQSAKDRETAYGQHDHCRLYGQDYDKRLEEAGFVVERDRPQHQGGEPATRREALNPNEEIFAARRPLQD